MAPARTQTALPQTRPSAVSQSTGACPCSIPGTEANAFGAPSWCHHGDKAKQSHPSVGLSALLLMTVHLRQRASMAPSAELLQPPRPRWVAGLCQQPDAQPGTHSGRMGGKDRRRERREGSMTQQHPSLCDGGRAPTVTTQETAAVSNGNPVDLREQCANRNSPL